METNLVFKKCAQLAVKNYITKLNSSKKTSGPIPTSILKLTVDGCHTYISDYINDCIENNMFPDELKLADVTPCHKKGTETDKTNYRPISIYLACRKYLKEYFLIR